MKKFMSRFLTLPVGVIMLLWVQVTMKQTTMAQGVDYPTHRQMEQRLNNLSRTYSEYARLQSLGKTAGGKDIWVLTIGRGDTQNRPAIAIAGGAPGDHLLGSEMAVLFAENVLSQRTYTRAGGLLDSVTFYVFPDLSPDAREQYFMTPRYQRTGNGNPTDLDRDGRVGEDGYNDLNNDGLITSMRVKDPTGPWMKHPHDERIMVWARPEKGEKGEYLIFSEGLDEDNDLWYNEDGEEGVTINRNFSFKYPFFTRGSGEHAFSENESRAIADFLYNATNVFAVISFGEANNLTKPLEYNESSATSRIPTGWQQRDVMINQRVSNLYASHIDSVLPTAAAGNDGDFFQWAYFHYGRYSFSTPGWTLPPAEKDDEYQSVNLALLNWAQENNISNVFVPWTPVTHPGFEGREVEVGGTAPFVLKNPPYAMVDSIARRHTSFILALASLRPRVVITNVKTERLGGNLHRVTVDILNEGSLPTLSQMGEKVRWVKQTVLRTTPANNQTIISGKAVDVIGNINPRYSVQRSWLIQGNGRVTLKAGSESTGFSEVQVNL